MSAVGRAQARVPEEYRTSLDLHEADLQGADLQEANLQGAILLRANLREARMPDGQKYEDWIESKGREEGGGKNNSGS
jgi:uncharacterized protein YjbI with pentapeptide repeats